MPVISFAMFFFIFVTFERLGVLGSLRHVTDVSEEDVSNSSTRADKQPMPLQGDA